jgi:tryptophanyl-tRNA synthetase
MTKRSLTGIRATGNIHLGNYLGAIKPALKRQDSYHCLYFIADLHSLTSVKEASVLREKSLDLAATWIAAGLDYKKHLLYRQSDVPMVTEFAWYLSSVTGMGFLEKAHAYKDATANEKEVNHAVFAYPVLMAADILMYDSDIVPVGKDQKQHVEMARDIAGSFNAVFGENIIKLPLPVIEENVMTIPGLDGRKMSKSYNNEIPIFCEEAQLKKLIMSIKTDSTGLEDPKDLNASLIGELLVNFTAKEKYDDFAEKMKKGGVGWGHAKQELFEALNNYIKDYREYYFKIRKDETFLKEVLKDGAIRASEIAEPVLRRVRKAVGFDPAPSQ